MAELYTGQAADRANADLDWLARRIAVVETMAAAVQNAVRMIGSTARVEGNLVVTGAATVTGALGGTLSTAAQPNITSVGTLAANLLFVDATYDIGASGATRPRDFFLSRNATVGGALTVAGLTSANGGLVIAGGGGAYSAGKLSSDATFGLVMQSITGTTDDWALFTPAGAYIAHVPTGTATFTITNAASIGSTLTVTGAFGCNGTAAQTPYASGGLLAGVVAALVANGILSN